VRIAAERDGSRLRLCVEDDGPGLEEGTNAELRRGIGLTNTAARLRHLYGDDQRFTIANRAAGGVRVELELPYRMAPRPGTS
jgi:two-component system, LytTR family, sensor kinase